MLTVSKSCKDAVTDNYSLRSSGWFLFPQVSELLNRIERERGQELRPPRSATYRVEGSHASLPGEYQQYKI